MGLAWFLEGGLFPSFLLSNQFNFPFVCFILAMRVNFALSVSLLQFAGTNFVVETLFTEASESIHTRRW